MAALAERIKEIRGLRTQKEFAELLGITQRAVINYEVNGRIPRKKILGTICEHFGITEEWLLTGEGPKYEEHLRRVAGVQTPKSKQPIENTGVDTAKNCDSRSFLEIQHQNSVLQERLSGALEKGMEAQEKIAALTEQNADLRVQAERQLSRIRELERENEELRKMRKGASDLRSQYGRDAG